MVRRTQYFKSRNYVAHYDRLEKLLCKGKAAAAACPVLRQFNRFSDELGALAIPHHICIYMPSEDLQKENDKAITIRARRKTDEGSLFRGLLTHGEFGESSSENRARQPEFWRCSVRVLSWPYRTP